MSTPTFIDVAVDDQCLDLRSYFKDCGADISDEDCPDSLCLSLQQIISVCDSCFREATDAEIEAVLNSIVSIIAVINPTESEGLVHAFCDKLAKASSNRMGVLCVRVLQNLYEAINPSSVLRYDVYYNLVKVALKTDMITSVFSDLTKLKTWLHDLEIPTPRVQKLLRLLHEALIENKQSELASKVMIELLSTYTEDNASQARDDAHRCIVSCLADPSTFLLDHLLPLKPVRFLEGELIHDLLTIFVAEKLSAYLQFYQANKDFITSLGLSHEQNMHKMRLLTLVQMAESQKEISFDTLQQELQLEEVEAFVVDALRTRMISAKINHTGRKVVVISTIHRTFGRQQWQQLKDTLVQWHNRLHIVESSMERVVRAQFEQLAPPTA
uniref:Eukaryotic translation initiation factor 3 subunit M n=1 Tax=Ornithodoros turicata TaxID=34597 RepID=A0A2R5LFH7_9ACAR